MVTSTQGFCTDIWKRYNSDIRCRNVLLDEDGRVKITGFESVSSTDKRLACQYRHAIDYMAPELVSLQGSGATVCSGHHLYFMDQWAWGATLSVPMKTPIPQLNQFFDKASLYCLDPRDFFITVPSALCEIMSN